MQLFPTALSSYNVLGLEKDDHSASLSVDEMEDEVEKRARGHLVLTLLFSYCVSLPVA